MFDLELPAKSLAQCMRAVSGVSRKNSIPILAHAHIKVSGGKLSACATDLDRWITSETNGVGSGEVTVNASDLESIAASLDGGAAIKIKANGRGVLEISQGRAAFELPTLPVEDFPVQAGKTAAHAWTFNSAELAAKLRALEPAIANDKRYYLCGVFFDAPAGSLVATNGHMLGRTKLAGLTGSDAQFTIPREALSVIYGLCKASEEIAVTLHEGAGSAQFDAGQISFRTKLIEEKFPNYSLVIPASGKMSGAVHCADFLRAVTCAMHVEHGHDGSLRVDVSFSKGEIAFVSRDQNGRTAKDCCEWERKSGGDLNVIFDGRYLRWAASTFGESAVLKFEIENDGSALVICAVEDVERRALRIVMPRR